MKHLFIFAGVAISMKNPASLKNYVNRFRHDENGEMDFSSGEMPRMIGYAHPNLLIECTGHPLNVFTDCTFRIVPAGSGFSQLMIIMVFLPQY